MHWLNFSDPTRTRVAKESVECYKQIVRENKFPSGGVEQLKYCSRNVDLDPGLKHLDLNIF